MCLTESIAADRMLILPVLAAALKVDQQALIDFEIPWVVGVVAALGGSAGSRGRRSPIGRRAEKSPHVPPAATPSTHCDTGWHA